MTDEPKPNDDPAVPPPLPSAVELIDPFDVPALLKAVPIEEEIPTIPVAVVRSRPLPPDNLPEALPSAEALPSRKPTVVRAADKPTTMKPAIDLEPPRPKVFLSLFVIFLMALAAALALTVLFYSIYVGFQTLKPNRKKAALVQVDRHVPATTMA